MTLLIVEVARIGDQPFSAVYMGAAFWGRPLNGPRARKA